MTKIAKKLTDLIGNTPMLELSNYNAEYNIPARIIAKLEYFNPTLSVKDRISYAMIKDAEDKKLISKDSVIIEPTSGNTGIGLAFVAASLGYKLIIVMPRMFSCERKKILEAYGVEVILTSAQEGMKGAIEKAQQLTAEIPNSFMPQQFANQSNPYIHKKTTAKEIWEDTNGSIDIFVAGIGTGGTITGVGEFLKEKNSSIKIVGVEPFNSPFISEGLSGMHGIQGIGSGFKPHTLNQSIIDEFVKVQDEEAFKTVRRLAKSEGLLVGISSGAALFAASQLATKTENRGKNIVVLLPDNGERYLSTNIFQEQKTLFEVR
ncbi:cysteine synthase A [Priestia megaterium]|uniref:cysteine synthase A n=1 Tax=Priestia megaterium TaxID=1404 RepID=UPI001BE99434|nr:cysteine synthase A [Priestia megaterium]MBT2259203.1 cysteine synthase A [Priestia megaterium]